MTEKTVISSKKDRFFYSFCLFISVISLMIMSCSAITLTDYTELNTNTTIHIKTELDLSENYSVLFDNEKLDYTPSYDIIKTGLTPDSEHSILIISDMGQIQTIYTKTLEGEKIPFYLIYGLSGVFVMSLILLVIGYLIPMIELIALPIELIGFIQAIKEQSAFVAFIFVVMFAISCMIYGYYNKNVLR